MPKLLIQVKAVDTDRLAIRAMPTQEGILNGQTRYASIITASAGQMLEMHLDDVTAGMLRAELTLKLAEAGRLEAP